MSHCCAPLIVGAIATQQIETSRKRVMEALLAEVTGPNGSFHTGTLKVRAGRNGR